MTEPVLELENLTKRFGKVIAADDLSFEVHNSELTALIGPNGAGKTTMYDLLTGALEPTSGRIRFQGQDITALDTATRVQRGLARSFQITNIFEGLSVRRNIRAPVVARSGKNWSLFGSTTEDIKTETNRYLEMVGLEEIADEPCETLSYGDKRRVEIGIVLATDPDIVLLDEPTAGMNPNETSDIVELVESLDAETDVSFFITEHDIDIVFSISDRVIVLDRGNVIADGTPAEIRNDPRVQSAYLGEET